MLQSARGTVGSTVQLQVDETSSYIVLRSCSTRHTFEIAVARVDTSHTTGEASQATGSGTDNEAEHPRDATYLRVL